jgi:hypothetical protein
VVLETANERRLTSDGVSPTNEAEVVARLAKLDESQLDDLIENLIAWTHLVAGDTEIVAAREQFFADNGKVFHDDSVYDARMSYFFDLLLFERALPAGGERQLMTPYERFLQVVEQRGSEISDAVLRRLKVLGDFRHSVFQLLKVDPQTIVLQDLLNDTRVTVSARPGETFRGLERKTLIQGFVFMMGETNHLSHGLILHPAKTTRVVKKLLKQAQKSESFSRKTVLSRLASLQVRHLRHRHVDPKTIYQTEPR